MNLLIEQVEKLLIRLHVISTNGASNREKFGLSNYKWDGVGPIKIPKIRLPSPKPGPVTISNKYLPSARS